MLLYYSCLVSGISSPEILVKLSNVIHVSTDYLLGIEDKKQTLDVTGLPDEDIRFLEDAVLLLRKKNQELGHS